MSITLRIMCVHLVDIIREINDLSAFLLASYSHRHISSLHRTGLLRSESKIAPHKRDTIYAINHRN